MPGRGWPGVRSPGPDRQQRDYWRKSDGTKRIKRDHRGREKDLPSMDRRERTRGPPKPEDHGGPYAGPDPGMPAPPKRGTRGEAEEKTEGPRTKNRRGKQSHKRPLEGRDGGRKC